MDETRQNLSCTVTPDVRFSDVLLPEHAKTQEIHRPGIAGPSARPNGPVLGGCRRSGTVGTSGCGSVPAALGRRWFWSALHVVNSSSMLFTVITLFLYFYFFQGVKNPPSTSRFEINNTFSAAFKLNKSLEPMVNLSDKQVVLNPLVPNASPLSSMLKAEHPSSMGVKSSGCDPPLQSEGCDLVSGLCALFPVISLTGDHDDTENPAVSSSPVVSGDIKGGSVVAAHTSLTGSGRQPGPGGVGACSDALLGAPPDKGGVLSGSEFSVADFNRFGGTPPPSGRVIAEIDTDLPPIRLTTLTSDPELGAAPSTGRSSSQSVNTLVKPGFSDSVWEPPSFLGIKYSWLQFSGQTMFPKLASCLYLILNMARLALTPVTQPSLDHSFSEPPSPTPPGLWTSEHLLFQHDSGDNVHLLGNRAFKSLRTVLCYASPVSQTRHTFEKQKGGGEPPPALRASFSHFQFTTISDHNKVASVKLQHNFEQVKSGSDLTAKPSASLQFQTEPSGKFKQVSLWVRNTRYKQFDNQIAYEPAPTDTSKLVSLWVRNTRFKTLF
ncbi:uncharacterized protein [Nothobranchius furzeri]|uniref:uncharacterized protein n=1 Tax=Nothobranchius furzeri TaxID=105023 RepID=UPI003904D30D